MSTPDQRDEKIEQLSQELAAALGRVVKLESSNAALARQSLSLMARVTTDDPGDGAINAAVISELRDRVAAYVAERRLQEARIRELTNARSDTANLKLLCENQRKDLHSLNVERRTTLTQLSELRERISTMERNTRDLDVDLEKCEERCDRQRKELHSMNLERRTTLTQLEDAQHALATLREAISGKQ